MNAAAAVTAAVVISGVRPNRWTSDPMPTLDASEAAARSASKMPTVDGPM